MKGGYDLDHAKEVFKIGLAHARYGVYDKLVCMCAGAWLREILKAIGEGDVDDTIWVIDLDGEANLLEHHHDATGISCGED